MDTGDFYCDSVLSGKIAVRKVIETENVLAFHHTRPCYNVHIVIIPKRHTLDLLSISEEDPALLSQLHSVVTDVVREVVREFGACRLTTNFGLFQQTKHLHWHVYVSDDMQGAPEIIRNAAGQKPAG